MIFKFFFFQFFFLFGALQIKAQNKPVTARYCQRPIGNRFALRKCNSKSPEHVFVQGTVIDDSGRFTLTGISAGNYSLEFSFIGYKTKTQKLFVGSLNEFLNLGTIKI